MIEITVAELKDQGFITAMQKLTRAEGFDGKVIYHIARLSKLLDAELRTINESYQKLLNEYTQEIEEDVIVKGEPKKQKRTIIPEEKMEAWQAAFKSFHEAKIKLPKDKLYFSYIEKFKLNGEAAGWSGAEILSLEPVLHDIEVVPPNDSHFRTTNLKPLEGGKNGEKESVQEKNH